MYIYRKNRKNRIIHFQQCGHAKKIKSGNRGYFYSIEEAVGAGYRFCKKCDPMIKEYKDNTDYFDNLWKNEGISCSYEGNMMHISAPKSQWLIIPKNKHKKLLYHRNMFFSGKKDDFFTGYHLQNYSGRSIMACIKYIIGHDKYRTENDIVYYEAHKHKTPARKGTKRWDKEQRMKKRCEKRQQLERVNNLIAMVADGRI